MRVVVSGLVAQHPELGGMTWHYLQYLDGFRMLGHDVYYLEDSGEWPYTWDGGAKGNEWVRRDVTPNVRYLAAVMDQSDMTGRWAYKCAMNGEWYGMSDALRNEVIRTAAILINVSGSLEYPAHYSNIERLIYVDTDPVFTQLALAGGDERRRGLISAHDVHVTFASDLSRVPNEGFTWLPTRQPINVARWSSGRPPDQSRYTTIMNWTSYEPVHWNGEVYGQKDLEFKRFLTLPSRTPQVTLEIALPDLRHAAWEQASDAGDAEPVTDTLRRHGWQSVNALSVATGHASYRDYIIGSRAEWAVAKNGYVRGRCGWFSERSACYLAAGRPVVTEDTGFSNWLPAGEGVLAYATLEEAVAAIEAVESSYEAHARAAKEIAHEYFSAPVVIQDLLNTVESSRGGD